MNASARLAFRLLRSGSIPLLNLQISLLSAAIPLALHASPAVAQAKGAEAVARIAQAITVRIEGATQGSGVLVKREGNRYTVLTAWHVVSGQRPGEELDVYTPDGKRHPIEQGSLAKLGEVDLAVVTFSSSSNYSTAPLGDAESVSTGSIIYVSGYPLPTSAVPTRIFRFRDGLVEANAKAFLPRGYQLLYSNPTLPGMSGGAVMDSAGRLVAIHGQSETDEKLIDDQGFAVKTGTSQAVPIGYFPARAAGSRVAVSSSHQIDLASQPVYTSESPDKTKDVDSGFLDVASHASSSIVGKQRLDPCGPPESLLCRIKALDKQEPDIVDEELLAAMPAPSSDRLWLQVRQPVSVRDLSSDLQLSSSTLAELNDVEAQHRFDRGDWVVLPSKQFPVARQLPQLDASQLRRTPPPPPRPGMPAPSADRLWVQVRQPVSLRDLSRDLQLQSSTLAELNDVEAQHRFDRGDWVVLPSKQFPVAKQLAVLDTSQLRTTPPPLMAPAPVQTTGVVRLGETLLQVAQRYGTTMQELVRLNPGLKTIGLVAGTEVQLVESAQPRQRAVLGLKPSTSGGLSWPKLP